MERTSQADSQPLPTEDRDAAATRRMYERDNEFLIAFQTRQQRIATSSIGAQQKTGLGSKSEPTLFPLSHTPSPGGTGSCVDLAGDGGSRVQLMKEQWEKGEPLQLPPYNEPKSASLLVSSTRQKDENEEGGSRHGCIVSDGVWGVARETPVTGGRSQSDGGGRGGGEETGEKHGVGDETGRSAAGGGGGGEEGGGGGGGKGDRDGGGGGGGKRGGGGGGDNWRRRDKDEDEEREEEADEETDSEEEEGEKLHGMSSTTPLLQTVPSPDTKPSTAAADLTPHQTSRDHVPPTSTPTDQPKVETVVPDTPLKVGRTSSQSELSSTDSSSVDMTLPPPPLHSTLLMSPLTPSQFRYLPMRSEEEREERRSKSHDIKPESHDQASESHDMSGHRDEPSNR